MQARDTAESDAEVKGLKEDWAYTI